MAEESSLHHGAIIRGVWLPYCAFNFPLFLLNLDSQPNGGPATYRASTFIASPLAVIKRPGQADYSRTGMWQLTIPGTVCPLWRGCQGSGSLTSTWNNGYTASISRKIRRMNVCCYTVFPFIHSRIPTREWFIHITVLSSHINY